MGNTTIVQASFFTFFLILYLLVILVIIYDMFFKGRIGPITRKGEYEEMMAKMDVLHEHGKTLNEKKIKSRWGLTWVDDDFDSDEIKYTDKLEE